MLIFLLLLLIPSSFYAMDYESEESEFFCTRNSIITTYVFYRHDSARIAEETSRLVKNKPNIAHRIALHLIRNPERIGYGDEAVTQALEFLLRAAEQHYPQFVDKVTNGDSILRASVEEKKDKCTEIALKHGGNLNIYWYKGKELYYPLKFACKKCVPNHPLIKLLRDYGAGLRHEDRHLLEAAAPSKL